MQVTDRERAVLQLLADGEMYKNVADKLCVSLKAIECRLAKVKQRNRCKTTAQAVAMAVREGCIQ